MSDRFTYKFHYVCNLGYHIIWYPKYRRNVLRWGIDERLKILLVEKAAAMGCSRYIEDQKETANKKFNKAGALSSHS